jgi:Na+/H+ antiporter NhaA
VSTLDSLEHFWKPFVDFGLGLFALVNAGVKLDGVGSMTSLILISLVMGKYFGITIMFKVGALNYINY